MNVLERLRVPNGLSGRSFVSRAGEKLQAAVSMFEIPIDGRVAADLGCNVGGFVDCLLQHGAARVYAVDTGYGVLAWKLRKDPRVCVMERTNALFATLHEPVDILTIDVGWTRQEKILPVAARMLHGTTDPPENSARGQIITLIKPHYESDVARRQKGVLTREQSLAVLQTVADRIENIGFRIEGIIESPLCGQGGNVEFLMQLTVAPLTVA